MPDGWTDGKTFPHIEVGAHLKIELCLTASIYLRHVHFVVLEHKTFDASASEYLIFKNNNIKSMEAKANPVISAL